MGLKAEGAWSTGEAFGFYLQWSKVINEQILDQYKDVITYVVGGFLSYAIVFFLTQHPDMTIVC